MDSNETVGISKADIANLFAAIEDIEGIWQLLQEAEKSRTTSDDQPLDQAGLSVDFDNSALSRRSERVYALLSEAIGILRPLAIFELPIHSAEQCDSVKLCEEISTWMHRFNEASVKATKPSG